MIDTISESWQGESGLNECDASGETSLRRLGGLSGGRERVSLQSLEFNFFGLGNAQSMSYAELVEKSDRFAGILKQLRVNKGDRLSLMLGRMPALYVCKMGGYKSGLVASPLHSVFGVGEIVERLNRDKVALLVITVSQYWRKIAAVRDQLPYLKYVFVVSPDENTSVNIPDTLDYHQLMA